jgi:acyl carrier protein
MMQISKSVRDFIVDNFLFGQDDGKLGDGDSLLQSGVIDSTGVLEIVVFLEEQFGIKVEDDELLPENLDSISNVAGFVERKKHTANA